MKKAVLSIILVLSLQCSIVFAGADQELKSLIGTFATEYKGLKIPELTLSYVENFTKIQNLSGINRQQTFFKNYYRELKSIDRDELSPEFRYQYDALHYQVKLDLDRLELEKHFKLHEPAQIPAGGIYKLPRGRDWYRYYVKKWASTDLSPTQLIKFGQSEVKRVHSEMKAIQRELGYEGIDKEFFLRLNEPQFTISNEQQLISELHQFKALILRNLNRDFEKLDIPNVDIKPIPNPTKDSPPGYYHEGVFYYNFFGNKFPKRSLEWLFIHEAVPGHHYQFSVAPTTSPLQELFWYPGFSEGWAAYTEDIGKDMDAYHDPYAYYGKWEWDLVRSVRVVLDVGINYFGWNKAKAIEVWKQNIPNQDSIAEREVDRMFRWPAQVLAYKVGERKFLELRERLKLKQNEDFDLRKFHTLVLERGSIPLTVLDEIIEDK